MLHGGKRQERVHLDASQGLMQQIGVLYLKLMLQRIAMCAPAVFYHTIVKNSTSLDSIWQTMKLYYGINDSTKPAVCLSPSNAPHQNCDEPFYQDYACMSDRPT